VLIVVVAVVGLSLQGAAQEDPRPQPLDCEALMAAPSPGINHLCEGEAAIRRATAAPGGSAERIEQWTTAASAYSRSVNLLYRADLKIHALEMLAYLNGPAHLRNPDAVEQALRALTQVDLGSPEPLMRLAKFQEEQERAEAAEESLFMARQQHPDSVDLMREMAKFFARRVLALTPKDAEGKAILPPPPEPAWKPDCQQMSFATPGAGLGDVCRADAEMRVAAKQVRRSKEHLAHLEAAADHYKKATGTLKETEAKIYAYDALARVYSAANLAIPREAEPAVRQLMALAPGDVGPILRLATLQEEMKQLFIAEQTLVGTRQLYPDEIEVLKALSRFYARQTSAASMAQRRAETENEPVPPPNQPDAEGNYRVGSNIRAPKKLQDVRSVFPDEAKVVGLEGVIIAEIWVDETGRVTSARLLRGIPMLEEAALAAVMQWRFEPVIVDGKPVPVRMTVTTNFMLQR
jgi:TonB family protein